MKIKGFALGYALAGLFCTSTFASELAPGRSDPVAELRHQDSAFSLLIEVYRQLQSRLIESDYDARLKAAADLPDLKIRRRVTALAKQEHDLRIKKLYGQLGNLATTYDYARQRDEREAGVAVPSAIDTATAAESLKNFVVITPAGGDSLSSVIPARTVLLDARKTP
jgi:hypothetical protein